MVTALTIHRQSEDNSTDSPRKSDLVEGKPIDVSIVELIYGIEREQDGYINLCRKVNRGLENLAGVKISELRNYLPELVDFLLVDSYFSVNASFGASPNGICSSTGFPFPLRKERYIKYLNACFADLDSYKGSMDWPTTVGVVESAIEEGFIPPLSIIARSGRGAYLLWLLAGEAPNTQQRASASKIELYKQINKRLIQSLNTYEPALNSDVQAHDASRLLRLPGSLHSGCDLRVNYHMLGVGPGQLPVYTLNALASLLDIKVVPMLADPKKVWGDVKNPGSAPLRAKGRMAVAARRLSDLETLVQHRGGFVKGVRWKSLSYYCYFAKDAGLTLSDIDQAVERLAGMCIPPYPSEDNDQPPVDIVKRIWLLLTPRKFKNDTLARFFEVTPELADHLNLQSIVPQETQDARARELSPREAARRARRALLKDIIIQKGLNLPTVRAAQQYLDFQGLHASTRTVLRDLHAVSVYFSLHYRRERVGGKKKRGLRGNVSPLKRERKD